MDQYSTPGAASISGLQDGNLIATKAELALKAPLLNPDFAGTLRLPIYTLATAPSPDLVGHLIYITDAPHGGAPCYSDGTTWIELKTGVPV